MRPWRKPPSCRRPIPCATRRRKPMSCSRPASSRTRRRPPRSSLTCADGSPPTSACAASSSPRCRRPPRARSAASNCAGGRARWPKRASARRGNSASRIFRRGNKVPDRRPPRYPIASPASRHALHTKPLRGPAGRRQGAFFQHPCAAAARPAVCRVQGAGRVLTRSLGPSSIPSLGDGVMLGTAWIDRPVDTQGCAPCFHVLLSAAWKCGHAQANDRHSSRVFAMPPRGFARTTRNG